MATGDAGSPTEPPEIPVDLGPIGPKQRYEFTPAQEAVIGDLAGKMRFVGTFLFALAILLMVQVVIYLVVSKGQVFDVFAFMNGLIYGLIGYWTLSSSSQFAAVVATVGWDVPHVMNALGSLRKMYALLYWLLIAAIAATLILLVGHRLR